MKKSGGTGVLIGAVCVILVFLVLNPTQNIQWFFMGLQVWATAILPALFPFLFFTKLLSFLGLPEKIGGVLSPVTQKLFHTDGISGYIYTMSMLSGYPVGAKLVSDFYERKLIDKGQAARITSYTSTSGPLFIVGTVGAGMFFSQTAGLIMLASHFVGALLNGLLYRNLYYTKPKTTVTPLNFGDVDKNVLEEVMVNTIKSITIIGGYIALFFMLISMINNYNLLLPVEFVFQKAFPKLPPNFITSILNGLVEVTRGCLDLSKSVTNVKTLIITGTALISFGGLSVLFQAFTFLKKAGITIKLYLLQKVTHCAIATTIAAVICVFI